MTASKKQSPDRREFLAHVATAAAAVAATACAAPLVAAGVPTHANAPFDDSWTRRVIAARHRAVMDSPGIEDGLALLHATFFMQGYREQLDVGASDVVPVVVLRHQGTAIALNDALWAKYGIGERYKVKDPATGADALRNPFIRVTKDDKSPLVPPDACLETLLANGVILLACNKAAMRLAGQVAQKFNRDAEEVRAEFRAGMVPGVLLQPSGIYATLRAQDVGCSFIKST
ncbi:MAG: ubiquinol-cytochrome c reductase iron-sulfur subunit N-terminal domain-containing protein [bacterium]